MRKGLQVLTPLIVGALIVSGSTAIAAVKAGSACSKAGITSIVAGKKFTCVKSGKKLVWNKGITVKTTAKPKATPEATASPTATSNPTLRQVWETISSESLAVWDIIKPLPSDLKGGGSRDITFAFSSDIPADSQEELKRQYRFTTTYWARFTPINQRLHVAVSKLGDVRFLCTERAKYIRTDVDGCVQYNPGPVIGAYTMFDDRSGTFNWMTIEPELKNFGTHEGWTSHHEYVHSVQYSVNKLHWETHPCWFEEGMAMLFSPALYSEGKLGLFLKLRNQQVRQNVGPWIGNPRGNGAPTVDDWSNWLWRATITKYDKSRAGDGCSNFSGSSPDTGIYHVGQLAVEKIIQKIGMAELFKLMTLTGELGWASAVKVIFGVTDRELNSELAQVIHRETLIARNNSYLENFCTDNRNDPDC